MKLKKKITMAVAALIAVVGVASAAAPAMADRNKPDGDWNDRDWQSLRNDKWREFKLVQTSLQPTTPPNTIGQIYVATHDAYDQWNNQIGTSSFVCHATRLAGAPKIDSQPELLCNGSMNFANKGDIQIQGTYRFGESYFVMSVVGGDAKFKFAKGQAKVWVTSPTEAKVKFDLN